MSDRAWVVEEVRHGDFSEGEIASMLVSLSEQLQWLIEERDFSETVATPLQPDNPRESGESK